MYSRPQEEEEGGPGPWMEEEIAAINANCEEYSQVGL
jgi:hypothetical protein